MTRLWMITALITCVRCNVNDLCNGPKASVVDCYDEQGVDLHYYPPAYILRNELFLPACSIEKITNMTRCYNTVLDACPWYRDDGPDIMSKNAFLALIVGICVNRKAYDEGMECLGDRRSIAIHYANTYCITPDLYDKKVWDAYAEMFYYRWDKWCRLMITGIHCSVDRIRRFGCSESFHDYLIYSSFVRLPVECYTNSSDFRWLDMYNTIPETLELHETTENVTTGMAPLSYDHLTFVSILLCYTVIML